MTSSPRPSGTGGGLSPAPSERVRAQWPLPARRAWYVPALSSPAGTSWRRRAPLPPTRTREACTRVATSALYCCRAARRGATPLAVLVAVAAPALLHRPGKPVALPRVSFLGRWPEGARAVRFRRAPGFRRVQPGAGGTLESVSLSTVCVASRQRSLCGLRGRPIGGLPRCCGASSPFLPTPLRLPPPRCGWCSGGVRGVWGSACLGRTGQGACGLVPGAVSGKQHMAARARCLCGFGAPL